MIRDVIKTARCTLRPFRFADVEDVLAYASDPAWNRYLIALPVSYTREDAEKFVSGQMLVDRDARPSWAIDVAGSAIGGVNLRFSPDHRIGEIGYGIAPRCWGQGLAFEVARAVIGEAFGAYPELVRIRARSDARNAQSLRVMEKLGMKREALLRCDRLFRGELVDEVICGLLRSEWVA